ncbi:MAG TPA: PAS domain S-box protein, partial [Gemmataceae bacterium]|nr:PAS domain S-box protein [Gemmataceae bacterium]
AHGIGLPGRVWANGQADCVLNVLEDGNFPRQGIASKAGLHGAFAFPIVLGGEIVGVLDFFSRELRQPDKDLVEMMTAIGSQIGQFIERQRVQDSLRGANEQLELLVRASPLAITSLDCHGRVLTWNTAAERIFGWTAAEVLGQPLPIVPSDQREAFQKRFASELQGAWHSALEVSRIRKDGSRVDVSLWTTPLRDAKNTIMAVLCFLADITDRKLLEEQFRQAQKMEAVGKLAGGVAHDFNNLLTVINGYGEILLGNLRQGDPLRGPMEEIKKAGDRAARLTRQLLAFSRKQVLVPVLLDFNTLLIEMEKMLGRLIGEDVSMTVCPAPDLWRVKVDPGQMEQVIMNIVINARDAMPKGGKLTLETANVVLDGAYVGANTEAHPGEHVRLTISDTGAGMDNATKVRVFEPFFTTKGPEKGTGLGLATVYGIVKQSGGHISVYSELGIGTTFKIYLPRVEDAVQTSKSQVGFKSAARGSETVLLVEDEEGVRTLARLVLQGKGYKVLEARHGGEALLICEQNKDPVHILLTDVVMPSISGRELAARLKQLRPALKVLYMSGYTDDAVVRHGILEAEMPFLQKPFSPDVLAEMVRHVLDAP